MFALEPGETGKLTLDKHDGVEGSPFCVVVAKSAKEQRAFAAEYDAMFESNDSGDLQDRITAMFQSHVLRIEGYKSEDVEDSFTQAGMLEILRKMLRGTMVPHEEKKS
jgi:glycine cleavage system regulatory protein